MAFVFLTHWYFSTGNERYDHFDQAIRALAATLLYVQFGCVVVCVMTLRL